MKVRKFYPTQVARRLHNHGVLANDKLGEALFAYFARRGTLTVALPSPAEWRHIEKDPSLPILTFNFAGDLRTAA